MFSSCCGFCFPFALFLLALATFLIDISNILHVAATRSLDKQKVSKKAFVYFRKAGKSDADTNEYPGGSYSQKRKSVCRPSGAFYGRLLRSPVSPAPWQCPQALEAKTKHRENREAQIPLKVPLKFTHAAGVWLDILMGAPHALSGVDF